MQNFVFEQMYYGVCENGGQAIRMMTSFYT